VRTAKAFEVEPTDPIGPWFHQISASGDAPCPFIGKLRTRQNDPCTYSRLWKSCCTSNGLIRVKEYRLSSAFDQESPLAIAINADPSAGMSGPL
jgi:hypothetical protein